jgi:hypothetical protein
MGVSIGLSTYCQSSGNHKESKLRFLLLLLDVRCFPYWHYLYPFVEVLCCNRYKKTTQVETAKIKSRTRKYLTHKRKKSFVLSFLFVLVFHNDLDH